MYSRVVGYPIERVDNRVVGGLIVLLIRKPCDCLFRYLFRLTAAICRTFLTLTLGGGSLA